MTDEPSNHHRRDQASVPTFCMEGNMPTEIRFFRTNSPSKSDRLNMSSRLFQHACALVLSVLSCCLSALGSTGGTSSGAVKYQTYPGVGQLAMEFLFLPDRKIETNR